MILRGEELFGDDDVVDLFVGEGLDLGLVVVVVQIDAHGFFGKHHRHVQLAGYHSRNADAAGLDGQHLIDRLARKQALPLPCHLAEQRDVHLVVDKAVHLEHVALAHNAVLADTIFQHLHKIYPPTLAGAFSASGSPAAKSACLFSIPGCATRTHDIMFHLVYRKHPALTRGFLAKIRKKTTPNLFVFSKSMTLSKNTETS